MPETAPLNAPRSKTDLFLSFTVLALQGFGGVLAVVQRELVEKKRWMTQAQFVEDWAVAQIMPGPNVVNFCLIIGGRHFGLGGALASLAGLLLAPLAVVLILASVFGGVWRGRQGNCACPVLGHSGELAELGLGNSQIGGEGAKAIADVLKSGTAVLTTLVLNENNIGDKVAKAIADALQSGMAMLHMLSLIT